MTVSILLADDHTITRQGLRSLIESSNRFSVKGEAENGRDAVKMALKLMPDITIMDINMPGLNGADATRKIVADNPLAKVIALSMYSDKRYITGMLKAGVKGYVLKTAMFDELATAINDVMSGKLFLSSRIAHLVTHMFIALMEKEDEAAPSPLTGREREVLQLIAEGGKTKDIADLMNVSVKTVETHRRRIMEKLNIHSIANLTRYAVREGLTSLDL